MESVLPKMCIDTSILTTCSDDIRINMKCIANVWKNLYLLNYIQYFKRNEVQYYWPKSFSECDKSYIGQTKRFWHQGNIDTSGTCAKGVLSIKHQSRDTFMSMLGFEPMTSYIVDRDLYGTILLPRRLKEI